MPINGKGSINDNNLGKRHLLLLISCLFAELRSLLTGSEESVFQSVRRFYQHCRCCRFSPHALFLGPLLGLPTQTCTPSSPSLSSSSTRCLSGLPESTTQPKAFCKSPPIAPAAPTSRSMTAFLTLPSFASQLYNFFLLYFCIIFTTLSLLFSLNSPTPFLKT